MHCRKFNTGSKRIQNLLTGQSKESDTDFLCILCTNLIGWTYDAEALHICMFRVWNYSIDFVISFWFILVWAIFLYLACGFYMIRREASGGAVVGQTVGGRVMHAYIFTLVHSVKPTAHSAEFGHSMYPLFT